MLAVPLTCPLLAYRTVEVDPQKSLADCAARIAEFFSLSVEGLELATVLNPVNTIVTWSVPDFTRVAAVVAALSKFFIIFCVAAPAEHFVFDAFC